MKRRAPVAKGFSLVEVVFALAVATFCIVLLAALLPVGLQSYHQADTRSAMANMATMVVRDLQSTSSTGTLSPRFGFTIPLAGGTASGTTPQTIYVDATAIATGTITAPPTGGSIYRISLLFSPPANGQRAATVATILISYPANADPTATQMPKNFISSFETTIALNRN